MNTISTTPDTLKPKDFATSIDVRWCPGCGDYSILKQVQTVLPELGVPRENVVFISGIGCSSRYPYYMNTYGMHGIHGRATAIASGLKAARPDLDVWIVTGDGDSLAIGGNHLIHILRRNFNVNILLFNNQIYGLTKGQYSPTSPRGKVSKTSPYGSVDHPFNPLALALGSGGTFISRSIDKNPSHMRELIKKAHEHKGTSLIEFYQNCMVFNNGAYSTYTSKETKDDHTLYLKEGEPLVFGENGSKGIKLDGFTPTVIDLNEESINDCWIHDPKDRIKASILTQFFEYNMEEAVLPRPFGVFYEENRNTYEDMLVQQIDQAVEQKGSGDLNDLLSGTDFWSVNNGNGV